MCVHEFETPFSFCYLFSTLFVRGAKKIRISYVHIAHTHTETDLYVQCWGLLNNYQKKKNYLFIFFPLSISIALFLSLSLPHPWFSHFSFRFHFYFFSIFFPMRTWRKRRHLWIWWYTHKNARTHTAAGTSIERQTEPNWKLWTTIYVAICQPR